MYQCTLDNIYFYGVANLSKREQTQNADHFDSSHVYKRRCQAAALVSLKSRASCWTILKLCVAVIKIVDYGLRNGRRYLTTRREASHGMPKPLY